MWTDDKCTTCNSEVSVKHYFKNRLTGDTFSQFFCGDECSDSYYVWLTKTHDRFVVPPYHGVPYEEKTHRARKRIDVEYIPD